MSFFNESKFNMWRACVGVIWIDGEVSSEEKEWILDKINSLPFTEDQKKTLLEDVSNNVDFMSIIPKITDKKDRAFLAHQIRVIGHLDNDFSGEEKIILESWNKKVLDGVNLDELNSLIEKMELDSYHEDNVFENVNKASIFESSINKFLKVVNPGDYVMPKNKDD